MELPVRLGQTIILQNPETSEEQPCHVIRVHRGTAGKAEVGIEFLKPAPKFWGVASAGDWIPRAPEITSDTF
jgi:hypothetical protein